MSTQHYYKRKLVNNNIEVEYSSEKDEITIIIDHKLNMGTSIGISYFTILPSYVEPLIKLLREIVQEDGKP